jgi:serine protease Do
MRQFSTGKSLFLSAIILSLLTGFTISFFIFADSSPSRPREIVFARQNRIKPADSAQVEPSFRGAASRILPSVVEVRISGIAAFFGGTDVLPENSGVGAGVVVARSGQTYYVITNNHVVEGGDQITLTLYDGTEYQAKLKGDDERKDIAVLSFVSENTGIPLGALGDSAQVNIGDWVLAVGNPFGFTSSVTAGIVSAKGRTVPGENISDFIQTDASINQGNSGGPLVNLQGEIIGINTWITTPSGLSVGLGFAIPSNNIKKTIADIIAEGAAQYGWLGVAIDNVSERDAYGLNYPRSSGVLVRQVIAGSPADNWGILAGDIVLEIDDEKIRNHQHLSRVIGDIPAAQSANFVIFRAETEFELAVTLGLRGTHDEIADSSRNMWPGMSLYQVGYSPDEENEQDAVVIQGLEGGSLADQAGLLPGDVVIAVNGNPTKNLLDFYGILNDTRIVEFDFLLNRSGEEITIGIIRP